MGNRAPFAEPDADAAAARSDELDAARLKRLPYRRQRTFARLHGLAFDHIQRDHGQA